MNSKGIIGKARKTTLGPTRKLFTKKIFRYCNRLNRVINSAGPQQQIQKRKLKSLFLEGVQTTIKGNDPVSISLMPITVRGMDLVYAHYNLRHGSR